MKRRDLIVATSGIVGGFALGCSDGTSTAGGTGGTPGTGGVGSGGAPSSGGSTGGTGGGATGGSGPSGGGPSTGGSSTGGSSTGGAGTGGAGTGGAGTGGAGTGGAGTGGAGTGGAGTGGGGSAVTCGSVDDNAFHKHPLEVTSEMIDAGVELELTAGLDEGIDPHTHPVTITAAMWTTLKNTGTLMVEGDDTAETHLHIWTITCA